MLDLLKNLAMKKLQEKMSANSLNEAATSEAASEGANALLDSLKGGDIGQIAALFGGANAGGANGVAENIQNKLSEILQSKGMSSEEAQAESSSTANDLISGLKEKFESNAQEDSAFDISQIAGLLGGGDAGDILNKAKNLFGK